MINCEIESSSAWAALEHLFLPNEIPEIQRKLPIQRQSDLKLLISMARVMFVLACAASAAGFCAAPLGRHSPACAARVAARTELLTMKKPFLSRGSFRKWEKAAVGPASTCPAPPPGSCAKSHSAVPVSDARR